jgi:hypothetical protein
MNFTACRASVRATIPTPTAAPISLYRSGVIGWP